MKNQKNFKAVFFFVIINVVCFASLVAQVPQLINYQGVLTNPDTGERLAGTYSMTFSIYSVETGGTAIWTETQDVTVQNGIFNALLGNVNPIPLDLFDGSDRYLGVKVGSDDEMTPRKKLVSVGYAMKAYNSSQFSGKDTSDFVGTDQQNSISTGMIQNNAVTAEKIHPAVISSIDGVSNDGGNVDLEAGDNITITPDDENNKITISAALGAGDNLGNHTATQNIRLNHYWLSGDGGNEGIYITNTSGQVGVGTSNPTELLDVDGNAKIRNDLQVSEAVTIWNNSEADLGLKVFGGSRIWDGYLRINDTPDIYASMLYGSDPGLLYGFNNVGNYVEGYLAGAYGAYGYNMDGETEGYLSGDYFSVYGRNFDSERRGYLGGINYGVYGEYELLGHWGGLGGIDHGVVGEYWNHDYEMTNSGYIGGEDYAVYGESYWGNYGYLGGEVNSVYGSEPEDGYAGYFAGDVRVTGTLYNPNCALLLDHPLDPENKFLVHSYIESPDMKNVYDGVITLDQNGEGTVELPLWFEAINSDFRYQLTPIGSAAPDLYIAKEISNNQFKIAGGTPGLKVSWQVTGIRQDVYAKSHRLEIEMEKKQNEKGKYLHPEEHGMPKSFGIGYEEQLKVKEARERRKAEREKQKKLMQQNDESLKLHRDKMDQTRERILKEKKKQK